MVERTAPLDALAVDRRPVPLGARLLLLGAIAAWLVTRLIAYDAFAARVITQPAALMPRDLPVWFAMADRLRHDGTLDGYDQTREVPLEVLPRPDLDYRTAPPSSTHHWIRRPDVPPGFAVVVAAVWTLPLPQNVYSVLLAQYLVDLLGLLLCCWIALRLHTAWAGVSAAWLYALHPALIGLASTPGPGIWCAVGPLALFALSIALRDRPARRWPDAGIGAMSGGILALLILMQGSAVVLTVILATAVLMTRRTAALAALAIACALPLLAVHPVIASLPPPSPWAVWVALGPWICGPWIRLFSLAGALSLGTIATAQGRGLLLAFWLYPAIAALWTGADPATLAAMFGFDCVLGGLAVGTWAQRILKK